LDGSGDGGMLKGAVSGLEGTPITRSSDLTMDDIEAALKRSVSRKHRDRDSLIFKLRYFEGLTIDEIGKAMGLDISPMGIGSILNRINGKLRARLAPPKRL